MGRDNCLRNCLHNCLLNCLLRKQSVVCAFPNGNA
jgi:hypothetical protein